MTCRKTSIPANYAYTVPKNYPTDPKDILIRVEEDATQGGKAYFQILHTFMGTLGFEEDMSRGIIIQLMTLGKLRIDGEEGSKRYELVREEDLLSEPEAKALFDDFIASQVKPTIAKPKAAPPPENPAAKSKTISISVQRPR